MYFEYSKKRRRRYEMLPADRRVVLGMPAMAFAVLCHLPVTPRAAAAGEGAAADKSAYTLFNPTPRELMREMSTDRPDVTESSKTVDAGHVQVELSFGDYVRDEQDGVKSETS